MDKRKSFKSGNSSSSSDHALPGGKRRAVKGKQHEQGQRHQKWHDKHPSLDGDESLGPCLERRFCALHRSCVPGGCVLGCGGGGVEHPGEKAMFQVETHLLYASHASAMTHWEHQKAAATAHKAAQAKQKPNTK